MGTSRGKLSLSHVLAIAPRSRSPSATTFDAARDVCPAVFVLRPRTPSPGTATARVRSATPQKKKLRESPPALQRFFYNFLTDSSQIFSSKFPTIPIFFFHFFLTFSPLFFSFFFVFFSVFFSFFFPFFFHFFSCFL